MVQKLIKIISDVKGRILPWIRNFRPSDRSRVISAFDTIGEGVLILDERERIVLANATFAEIIGRNPASMIGMIAADLNWNYNAQEAGSELLPWIDTLRTRDSKTGITVDVQTAEGGALRLQVSCAPINDINGASNGVLVTFDDMSELEVKNNLKQRQPGIENSTNPRNPTEIEHLRIKVKQLEDIACKYSEELNYKSNYDSLTGLPNQLLFYDRIRQAIIRGQLYNQIVVVLTLDISLFKRVNNALGRDAGDLLLKTLADRLSGVLRKSDVISLFDSKSNNIDLTVSRLTADEFGILLTELTNKQAVTWIVKRLFESVSEPVIINTQKIFINCNIGISLYPEDGITAEDLLNHAVAARQYAKQMSGQNNYQIYDDQMHKVSLTQMHIDTELRRAIENEEFVLYYQPKVDMKSSTFNGVEALIRWNHPAKGILSPYEFIGVAEQSGLIVQIGEWVIRQACLQAKSWLAMGLDRVKVAVNLSTLQLRQEGFSERILEILKNADLSPRHFELEITETVIMDNLETAVDTLTRLHKHGFWISIDDFGTGYSSLNYLKHLPLDTLKIDRSFLQDILTDSYDKTIVKTIIAMAHSMDLKVTAEGVETGEQLDLLRSYSCDEIQGYLYSRPVPAPEATKLLQYPPRRLSENKEPGEKRGLVLH